MSDLKSIGSVGGQVLPIQEGLGQVKATTTSTVNLPNIQPHPGVDGNTNAAAKPPLQNLAHPSEAKPLETHKAESISPAMMSEIEAIDKVHGELWKCVTRTANDGGGHIFKFKIRDEFNDIDASDPERKKNRKAAASAKLDQIYPAVEQLASSMAFLDPNAPAEKSEAARLEVFDDLEGPELKEVVKLLNVLGYKCECSDKGANLQLPDKDALEANWEKLRNEKLERGEPDIGPLNILLSPGIATDREYTQAFGEHDVLLSTGKEFVHDQLFHVIPMLVQKLFPRKTGEPTFVEDKKKVVKVIEEALTTLDTASAAAAKQVQIPYKSFETTGTIVDNLKKWEKELEEEEISPIEFKFVHENMDKMYAILGYFADTVASISNPIDFRNITEEDLERHIKRIGFDTSIMNYFEKRFNSPEGGESVGEKGGGEASTKPPQEKLDPGVFSRAWKIIKEIKEIEDEKKIG